MKCLLVHPCTAYDGEEAAKQGVKELIGVLPSKDVIELRSSLHPGTSYTNLNKYFNSRDGEFPSGLKEELEDENEFVLAGGSFNYCHKISFKELVENAEEYEITVFFPGDSIYEYSNSTLASKSSGRIFHSLSDYCTLFGLESLELLLKGCEEDFTFTHETITPKKLLNSTTLRNHSS